MIDKLYIDGKDAYLEYGVFVADNSYGELVGYPPLKSVNSNDWQQEDGVEVDLQAPVLDSRSVSLRFVAHGSKSRIGAFVEQLSTKAYHAFKFTDLSRVYRLRLVSQPNLALYDSLGFFTLNLSDDFPLSPQVDGCNRRSEGRIPVQGYEFDGVDLSEYGAWVLKGSLQEVEKAPAVKQNLLRNIGSLNGVIYDDKEVVFQTKDVRLSCLIRAETLDGFWQNHDALLLDLIKPNERSLYVESTGYEYPCHYKGCDVKEFYTSDGIWFRFDLTLVFTCFRVEQDEYLLSSQDGQWIVTEDGDFAVNLKEL